MKLLISTKLHFISVLLKKRNNEIGCIEINPSPPKIKKNKSNCAQKNLKSIGEQKCFLQFIKKWNENFHRSIRRELAYPFTASFGFLLQNPFDIIVGKLLTFDLTFNCMGQIRSVIHFYISKSKELGYG